MILLLCLLNIPRHYWSIKMAVGAETMISGNLEEAVIATIMEVFRTSNVPPQDVPSGPY